MLNFALVGCGGMANWHAQQLQKLADVKVVALCDNVSLCANAFNEKYFKEAAVFHDYEQMLTTLSGQLDAVVLVTPHTTHYPQAKMALEHGVNVLVEKPMVTRSADAYDLWHTVKRTGKQLGITFQAPYTAEYGYLAQERDAGRLGKIEMISGWAAQSWMKATAGKWRQDPAMSGGGFLYDTGAHALNALMWLMNDPVVEVGCFYDKHGSPVDINGVASLKFQNGAMGNVTLAGNCPQFQTDITLFTDTMLIRTDQYGRKLEMRRHDQTIYPHVPPLAEGQGTPHANFANALLGREALRCGVRNGVLLSVLMDAMYESGEKQQVVTVAPVPNEI